MYKRQVHGIARVSQQHIFPDRAAEQHLVRAQILSLIHIWFVQKRMLYNQLKYRKAVSRASGYVPETVRNLRTIRTLGYRSSRPGR